jgi:hypothetical protein
MSPSETPPTQQGERRAIVRSGVSAALRITLENPTFAGRADSIGNAGVFFFSPDRLRVRVEYQENGEPRARTGYLVRVQRMSAETNGYAIEFDRE